MAKTKDTRRELLQTAIDLICAEAFATVSVDDICKKAGAQKGSFYHFFASKAELGRAALEHLWEEHRPELDHLFSSQVPGLDRLRNYADASLKDQQDECARRGFVMGCPFTSIGSECCSGGNGLTETAWGILQRFRKYMVIAVRDAIEEGAMQSCDYEAVADEMFLHYMGANVTARISGSVEPLKNLFERWDRMILGRYRTVSPES